MKRRIKEEVEDVKERAFLFFILFVLVSFVICLIVYGKNEDKHFNKHMKMYRQHKEMYRIILKKNLKDQDGQSLLHCAASNHNNSEIYKMIMDMVEDKKSKG